MQSVNVDIERAKARLAGMLKERLPAAKVEVGPRPDYFADRLPDTFPTLGRTEIRLTIGDFHVRDEVDNFDIQQDDFIAYYVDYLCSREQLRQAYARLG